MKKLIAQLLYFLFSSLIAATAFFISTFLLSTLAVCAFSFSALLVTLCLLAAVCLLIAVSTFFLCAFFLAAFVFATAFIICTLCLAALSLLLAT